MKRAARHAATCLSGIIALALSAHLTQARAGDLVDYTGGFAPGAIVVKTSDRILLLVTSDGKAIKYSAGVGQLKKQWFGITRIVSKHVRPAWAAPRNSDRAYVSAVIPAGSPRNPLGAAALVLADQDLAIHGTNDPNSIGKFISLGCIRLKNEDITDLYSRVRVGTTVAVLR